MPLLNPQISDGEPNAMDAGEMLYHLHSKHGYNLLVCSRNHHTPDCDPDCDINHHTPDCDLHPSGEFRFVTDTEYDLSIRGIPIPPVSLVDHRHNQRKKAALARIKHLAKSDPKKGLDDDEEGSEEEEEIDEGPSTSVTPAVSVLPEDDLSRALKDFSRIHGSYHNIVETPDPDHSTAVSVKTLYDVLNSKRLKLHTIKVIGAGKFMEQLPMLEAGTAAELYIFLEKWE